MQVFIRAADQLIFLTHINYVALMHALMHLNLQP